MLKAIVTQWGKLRARAVQPISGGKKKKKTPSSWQQRSPLFLCCILETTTNCRFLKVRTTYNRWFFLKFYVSRCFTWKVKGHFPALGLLPWFPARQELGIHSHLPQGNRYPISWNRTCCLPRCPGTENWNWKQIQNLNPDTDIRWGNPKHRLTHWWCYFFKNPPSSHILLEFQEE